MPDDPRSLIAIQWHFPDEAARLLCAKPSNDWGPPHGVSPARASSPLAHRT